MSSPTEPPTTGTQLSPRGRVLVLSLTMAAIASAGVGLTIWSLYTTAFKDQREALVAMVEGRARLIEAVARFDAVHSVLDHPAGAAAATLSQVIDAHRYFAGFGQSGEFLLGHLEDGQVQFLLKRRFSTPDAEQAIGLDSELAEPMRRALQGQHGSVIGLDYRGVEVLAAYHRVDVLDLALVAKIDTREIRTPYLQAGLASCGVLALLIIAGGLLFQRLTSPLITDLASAVSRLETAQQVAGLGHWDWNAGRNELAWNGQLARIFGRSSAPAADDASEPAYMKLVHPEDRLQVLKELQELMFDGGQRSFEHRVEVEDGEPRHVQVIAQAEHRASGTVAGIRGTVQDITDRKRHEREQHRLEQRLRRSEKMEAIGQLAGGVAHDFNNLLTVIYGHGEMLCETLPEGDGTHTSVKQMLEAARRGSELTRQMLSFSYERELAVKVLDWSELVNRMMGMLHRLLGEDISVRMECVERDVRVKADASQLEQIVLNLAINARDAMPLGGELALRIHTAEVSDPPPNLVTLLDPGSYVVLSVVDNGSGMSPATQERIFEPFFTTKGVGRGTGLGLATVFAIVGKLRGGIALHSELGKGSVFRIYLPRCQEQALAEEREAHRAMSAPAPRQQHILVVEDDGAVRSMVQSMLRERGYRVTVAVDGMDALKTIASGSVLPDLLISDVVMPSLSGPDLVHKLRELDAEMPMIFMSGYRKGTKETAAPLPAHALFLRKPFGRQELEQAVIEALADSERHHAADHVGVRSAT